MPYLEEDWSEVIEVLGYSSEAAMLRDLYEYQQFSLNDIAQVVGKSSPTVRRRLIQYGIPLRSRGGANHNTTKLEHVPDITLFGTSLNRLAEEYDVNPTTVYLERKRRKEKV